MTASPRTRVSPPLSSDGSAARASVPRDQANSRHARSAPVARVAASPRALPSLGVGLALRLLRLLAVLLLPRPVGPGGADRRGYQRPHRLRRDPPSPPDSDG